jgi:hypothetical protein
VRRPAIVFHTPAATDTGGGVSLTPAAAAGRPDPAPAAADLPTVITVDGVGDCHWHGPYQARYGCQGCLSLTSATARSGRARQIGGDR